MKDEAGQSQVQDRSHGGDVRAVVAHQLSQRGDVPAHVPVPQDDRGGPVHIADIVTKTDVQRLLDRLLAAPQAEAATEVHQVDVRLREHDSRVFPGDELHIETDPVERDQDLGARGIFEQRTRVLSPHEGLRLTPEGPADDGDLVVVVTEAGGLDIQEEDLVGEGGAKGELVLQLRRDRPPGGPRCRSRWTPGGHRLVHRRADRRCFPSAPGAAPHGRGSPRARSCAARPCQGAPAEFHSGASTPRRSAWARRRVQLSSRMSTPWRSASPRVA